MRTVTILVLAFILSASMVNQSATANHNARDLSAAHDCWEPVAEAVYVPETGHHIFEPFLSTWRQYDLAILGYPVSEPMERDGITVQYFERARFEHHPEFSGTPHEVLLTLLGRWSAGEHKDPAFDPVPESSPHPDPEARYYPETGHYLQALFREFWDTNGGLPVFGYPISEIFIEGDREVQYFERARFEHHPEHAGTAHEVQLGHLGTALANAEGIELNAVDQLEDAVDYRWTPEPRDFRIPALLYHHFGSPASRYQVTFWDFEQQLIWLRDNGYTPATMHQVYMAMFGGGSLPEQPVVLTFDDAFPEQWEIAAILEEHGMRGTFFVHPDKGLSNEQIRSLTERGHEIGSHTLEHPPLTSLTDAELWEEIALSRSRLVEITGRDIEFLAYPYGNWDDRVVSTTIEAGYCGAADAVGGQHWTPEKRWHQPRIEISGELSLAEFATLVSGP